MVVGLRSIVGRGRRNSGWTYSRSGVDRGEVARGLSALLAGVRYRPPASSGRRVELPGHFAGLVRVGHETIAITTDTVGTKSLLAAELGRWEEVGEDVVAVNVNDLAAIGARPCGFVDCLSCDRPDPVALAGIGRGIDRGLRLARCHLLGGETAVVPELLQGLDLGGTAIGFFPAGRRPVTGDRARPGDVLLGIPSSGFHANGLTLVRRLVAERKVDLRRPRPGGRRALGRELLTPTRSYVAASEAIADDPGVRGFAHISGGGVRNLVRLNPEVAFVLDGWPEPSGLFAWIRELGAIASEELYQTFNVGIGFVVVATPASAGRIAGRLRRAGYPGLLPIGHVARGTGVELPKLGLRFSSYS